MTPMSDGRTACLGFGVTRHESRITAFISCFGRRVARNAGWTQTGWFVHTVSTTSISDNPIITTTVP